MARETVQDLQTDDNKLHRLFRQFSSESKAISISTVALVIATLSLLMAWMAVYDAIHAKARVDVVLQSNVELSKEVRLLQYKIDLYNAHLEAEGETEHEP